MWTIRIDKLAEEWDKRGKGALPPDVIDRSHAILEELQQLEHPRNHPSVRRLTSNMPGVYVVDVGLRYRLMFRIERPDIILLGVVKRENCYSFKTRLYRAIRQQ